jgi:hypothetical protein
MEANGAKIGSLEVLDEVLIQLFTPVATANISNQVAKGFFLAQCFSNSDGSSE